MGLGAMLGGKRQVSAMTGLRVTLRGDYLERGNGQHGICSKLYIL
jgi:hypothetical protein